MAEWVSYRVLFFRSLSRLASSCGASQHLASSSLFQRTHQDHPQVVGHAVLEVVRRQLAVQMCWDVLILGPILSVLGRRRDWRRRRVLDSLGVVRRRLCQRRERPVGRGGPACHGHWDCCAGHDVLFCSFEQAVKKKKNNSKMGCFERYISISFESSHEQGELSW